MDGSVSLCHTERKAVMPEVFTGNTDSIGCEKLFEAQVDGGNLGRLRMIEYTGVSKTLDMAPYLDVVDVLRRPATGRPPSIIDTDHSSAVAGLRLYPTHRPFIFCD